MKTETTTRDRWGWRLRFVHSKTLNDFVIYAESNIHPENNHFVGMSFEEAKQFTRFMKRQIKGEKK